MDNKKLKNILAGLLAAMAIYFFTAYYCWARHELSYTSSKEIQQLGDSFKKLQQLGNPDQIRADEIIKRNLAVLDPNTIPKIKEIKYKEYNPVKDYEKIPKSLSGKEPEVTNTGSYTIKMWENFYHSRHIDPKSGNIVYLINDRLEAAVQDETKYVTVVTDKNGKKLYSEEGLAGNEHYSDRTTSIRDARGNIVAQRLNQTGIDENNDFIIKTTTKLPINVTQVRVANKESIEKIAKMNWEKSDKSSQAKKDFKNAVEDTNALFYCMLGAMGRGLEACKSYEQHTGYDKARIYSDIMDTYGVSRYYDSSNNQLTSEQFNDDKFQEYMNDNVNLLIK